jgi:hypothetical protein
MLGNYIDLKVLKCLDEVSAGYSSNLTSFEAPLRNFIFSNNF